MTDYIDRQTAIDAVSSMFAPTPTQKDMVEDCLETIENLPLVEVEPVKHGKWEWIGGYGYQYRCSECIMCVESRTRYCPHCGALMRGNENADEITK